MFKFFPALISISLLVSCSKSTGDDTDPIPEPPPPPAKTPAQKFVRETYNSLVAVDSLKEFAERFKNVQLTDAEVADGITILAPSNRAIGMGSGISMAPPAGTNSLQSVLDDRFADSSDVRDYLFSELFHEDAFVPGLKIRTLSGKTLYVERMGGIYINGQKIVSTPLKEGENYLVLAIQNLLQYRDFSLNDETVPGNGAGSTGYVTFPYLGGIVQHVTVRAKDGRVWLRQSLGSLRVANSEVDAPAYGDYFQWGRWDDGHQLVNSQTSPVLALNVNNPAGIAPGMPWFLKGKYYDDGSIPWLWWRNTAANDKWNAPTPYQVSDTNGCDPCKALGPKWRMPTYEEWIKVIADENIINSGSAYSSSLRLTLSGFRLPGSGELYDSERSGTFWNSTISTGMNLTHNIGINVDDNVVSLREHAMPVRCIREQ